MTGQHVPSLFCKKIEKKVGAMNSLYPKEYQRKQKHEKCIQTTTIIPNSSRVRLEKISVTLRKYQFSKCSQHLSILPLTSKLCISILYNFSAWVVSRIIWLFNFDSRSTQTMICVSSGEHQFKICKLIPERKLN